MNATVDAFEVYVLATKLALAWLVFGWAVWVIDDHRNRRNR